MKKVLFLLAVLFVFATTATAATTTTDSHDRRPKKGYNYNKANKKAARQNFFFREYKRNGGCGWAKATR